MKSVRKSFMAIILIALVGSIFTSCKEEVQEYQVRVRNSMYTELMGYPFMKYDIVEFLVDGKVVANSIPQGGFSDYFTVSSNQDYDLSVKVERWLYNADTGVWQQDSQFTETYQLGTETWKNDECDPQRIVLNIGTLLQLYKAVHEVYCD